MQKDTIIYVTDQRQKYLADMLGGEQTDCRNSGGIDYERVGNIVFPTPFSKLKLINSDIEKLKHNIIINNIAVWGGMMPECFPGIDRGCDFMRDETVIEQNAIVTAEATASIAITKKHTWYIRLKGTCERVWKMRKGNCPRFFCYGSPCHGDGKEKTGKA